MVVQVHPTAQFLVNFQTLFNLEVFINMEVELKTCRMCKLNLPKDDEHFAARYDRSKKQYQSNCRECQKDYRKTHYLNNRQKYIDKAKNYKDTFIQWFIGYKKNLSCQSCGENRYWVLDFHHKDPNGKDAEVSTLLKSCNKQKILDEISKCVVLCSNCHRDLHHQEKQAGIA